MTRIIFIALLSALLMTTPLYASDWLNSNIKGAVTDDYTPALKDDFYVNVNHDWLSTAQLRPGYSRNAAFTELQDIIDARLKAIMTDKSSTGHDAELVKALYSLWLDWDSRNEEGLSELKAVSQNLLKVSTIDELTEYFKGEESFYHDIVIADFGLGRDNKDSESHNLELMSTPLPLGDSAECRELTQNGARTKKMHDAIVSYMLRRLGYSEDEAGKFLAASFRFEKAIAAKIMTLEEVYSPDAIEKMYNPLTLEELRKKSTVFPFAEILEAHSVRSNLMNLNEPEWLAALNELYTPANLEDIKAYLFCKLAEGYED